jgi:hypothetical protein
MTFAIKAEGDPIFVFASENEGEGIADSPADRDEGRARASDGTAPATAMVAGRGTAAGRLGESAEMAGVLIVLLIAVCWARGEPPRWRRGKK